MVPTLERHQRQAVRALKICLARRGVRGRADTLDPKVVDRAIAFLQRVLFVFFADDRGMLPLPELSSRIRELRRMIAELVDNGTSHLPASDSLCKELHAIFAVIGQTHNRAPRHKSPTLFDTRDATWGESWELDDREIALAVDQLSRTSTGRAAVPEQINYALIPPQRLGTIYETLLRHQGAAGQRKRTGSYYTPDDIVAYIVQKTVQPWLGRSAAEILGLRILDPAVGTGPFLLEAAEQLAATCSVARTRGGTTDTAAHRAFKQQIIRHCLYGVDTNPIAIELAKLIFWIELEDPSTPFSFLDDHFRCGNSLVSTPIVANYFDWQAAFPEIWNGHRERRGFDGVLANPPYLNIRVLTREHDEEVKAYFRETFRTARGNFDLYVLFIERALMLLGDRGRFGMIVPNKLGTLEYARECPKLLLEQTRLEWFADMSHLDLFTGTGVYPYVIVGSNEAASADHTIRLVSFEAGQSLREGHDERSPQMSFSAAAGFTLQGNVALEKRVPTSPLGAVTRLHCGTTGFYASRVAAALREERECETEEVFEFIVSGNIDRYVVRTGNVRFAKRRFLRPVLPRASNCLSAAKRTLFQGPKLVVAGMSRRLEGAYDPGGLALGVQVFAAADLTLDYRYLLGLLNSRLLSYLFGLRFQAKHLANGYLSINKGQLALLPIRLLTDEDDRTAAAEIGKLVDCRTQLSTSPSSSADLLAIDEQIEERVNRLYRLTSDEVAAVRREVGN